MAICCIFMSMNLNVKINKFLVFTIQLIAVFTFAFKVQNQFSYFEASFDFSIIEEIESEDQEYFNSIIVADFVYSSIFTGFSNSSSEQITSSFLVEKISYLKEFLFLYILGPPIYK